jgi:hypothetical protein
MSTPPPQLLLTGNVHPSKAAFASMGDAAVHPGAGRTSFIDAAVFDGGSWRALDLAGFGFRKGDRGFDHSAEIGALMRQIAQAIGRHRGATVYYEVPSGGTRRKYVYRGVSFASVFPGRQNFF